MANINEIKGMCVARIANKKVGNYSNDELDTSIRNAFIEVMGTDTFRTKRDFHRAYDKHKSELYEINEEAVDQYIRDAQDSKGEFFRRFVEFKTESAGDANEFYVDNDQDLVVSKVSQGNWSIDTQRIDAGQTFSVTIGYVGIAIEEEFYRFVTGRCDYPRMVMKMAKAIDDYITNLAYDSFVTALNNTLPIFKPSGTYNADKFAQLVQSVESANGQTAYILGTKNGLRKIQASTIATDSAMSSAMKDEVNRVGYLTHWNGVDCIEIPQGFKPGKLVKEVSGQKVPDFIFDDSKVFVLTGSEKPIKIFMESPEMNRNWQHTDNEDMTMGQEMITGIGATIAYNKVFGSYTLV